MNYENFNKELLKRLSGYPIGMKDRNNIPLTVGEIVKFYYTIFEKEYNLERYVSGKIKYDILNKQFVLRLNEKLNNFTRNLILDKNCIYLKGIETTGKYVKDNYSFCHMLIRNRDDSKDLYVRILNLFEDGEIQLLESEIKYMQNELNDSFTANVSINININENEEKGFTIKDNKEFSNDIEKLILNYMNLQCNNIELIINNNNNICLKKSIK